MLVKDRVPGLMAGLALAAAAAACGASGALPPAWHYAFVLTVRGDRYRVTHHTVPHVGGPWRMWRITGSNPAATRRSAFPVCRWRRRWPWTRARGISTLSA